MPVTHYATPGVYVEELSTLPPSITEIGTAIPAFIGYTVAHATAGVVEVDEVNSLREFESRFGQAPVAEWKVRYDFVDNADTFTILESGSGGKTAAVPVERFSQPKFLLWYAVDHYFRNGGSRCYILSIGQATTSPVKEAFLQ